MRGQLDGGVESSPRQTWSGNAAGGQAEYWGTRSQMDPCPELCLGDVQLLSMRISQPPDSDSAAAGDGLQVLGKIPRQRQAAALQPLTHDLETTVN